ncbi:MAG TPA: hypothetical protein DCW55_00150, partial [Candidatus Pacebacteria bacterium]|nr:hypothetical protein [Candidatus Paceibacterota bacterium]HAX01204.1 hypothetical protein [Candidatus Paceibacterota bacterium]
MKIFDAQTQQWQEGIEKWRADRPAIVATDTMSDKFHLVRLAIAEVREAGEENERFVGSDNHLLEIGDIIVFLQALAVKLSLQVNIAEASGYANGTGKRLDVSSKTNP